MVGIGQLGLDRLNLGVVFNQSLVGTDQHWIDQIGIEIGASLVGIGQNQNDDDQVGRGMVHCWGSDQPTWGWDRARRKSGWGRPGGHTQVGIDQVVLCSIQVGLGSPTVGLRLTKFGLGVDQSWVWNGWN